VSGGRAPWDFDYAPITRPGDDGTRPEADLLVATTEDLDAVVVTEALAGLCSDVAVTSLFASHPIFWTRIESSTPLDRAEVARRIGSGIVRYVASARRGSQLVPPPLCVKPARPRQARDWRARQETSASEPDTPWRWFLRAEGVDVSRAVCGTGAGTRIAIVDNDGRDLDRIALDAEVPIGVDLVPRSQSHAAMMLGWTVGARAPDGSEFRGVAPDASPRLYCIPKPGQDVWSLPLAIAFAVEDGADVIVCPTYVEGQTSPMLDDALEFATKLGRQGRGTAVVMPTGREMSSPSDAVYSSLSLALSDPASDPRVYCIGPSSRSGGWFLWRDKRGKFRPFANRGPAVRWLAPGDDLAYPFSVNERAWHAESSGAAGVACGVMLLLLGKSPSLTLPEVDRVLTESSVPVDPGGQLDELALGERRDLLPYGRDRDRHNAKHGYGRLNATAACASVSDPVALTLARMGELEAATHYLRARSRGKLGLRYSDSLARSAATHALSDRRTLHAFAVVLRALRLWSSRPERLEEQPAGQLMRQIALALRLVRDGVGKESELNELSALEAQLNEIQRAGSALEVERRILDVVGQVTGWNDGTAAGPTAKQSGFVVRAEPASGPIPGRASRTGSFR
jgi:hypothetical protein